MKSEKTDKPEAPVTPVEPTKPKAKRKPKTSASVTEGIASKRKPRSKNVVNDGDLFDSKSDPVSSDPTDHVTKNAAELLAIEPQLLGERTVEKLAPAHAPPADPDIGSADPAVDTIGLPEVNSEHWYFLTNRSNLLSIIGSGAITAASEAWRYVEDSRREFGDLLPLWRGSLPPFALELMQREGVSSPVLLEYSDEVESWLSADKGDLRLCSAPIPFSTVRRVIFKDQNTLEDFRLKQFEDLPELPAELLHHGFPEFQLGTAFEPERPSPISYSFASFDKLLGALVLASNSIETRTGAKDLYRCLLCILIEQLPHASDSKSSRSLFASQSAVKPIISESSSDVWLLDNTLMLLDSADPDAGFDGFAFINSIETAVAQANVSSVDSQKPEDIKDVLEWCGHCRQLLEGKREIWALKDTEHTFVKRAVLLFMLRPEQERFRKVMGSSINPGPRVHLLAAFLLGYYTGITKLESPMKKSGNQYFRLIAHFLKIARFGVASSEELLKVETVMTANDRMELKATHGDLLIGSWNIPVSRIIRKNYQLLCASGFNPSIDIDRNLLTIVDEKRKLIIHIQELKISPMGDLIRIYANLKSDFETKSRSMESQCAWMMELNGHDDILGKFATIDGGEKLIYAVDHSCAHLSHSEIKFLVQHVSDVASMPLRGTLIAKSDGGY